MALLPAGPRSHEAAYASLGQQREEPAGSWVLESSDHAALAYEAALESGGSGSGSVERMQPQPPVQPVPAGRYTLLTASDGAIAEALQAEEDGGASDAGAAACWGGLCGPGECDDRLRTTALVNCSGIMERVDEQLLPVGGCWVLAGLQ